MEFIKTLSVTLYDTVPLLSKAGSVAVVRDSDVEEWIGRGYRRLTPREREAYESSGAAPAGSGASEPSEPSDEGGTEREPAAVEPRESGRSRSR